MATARLELVQGDRWLIPILWRDPDGAAPDLTGASAVLQLRPTWADDDAAAALVDLDTDGGLVVDGPAGSVTATVPADDTRAITRGVYVLEVKVDLGGGMTRLVLLEVEVLPTVIGVQA
jgi:hypothetical protein